MTEAEDQEEQSKKASKYPLNVLEDCLFALVAQCKMADGTVPAETAILITVEDARMLHAAGHQLKNLRLMREMDAKETKRGRR